MTPTDAQIAEMRATYELQLNQRYQRRDLQEEARAVLALLDALAERERAVGLFRAEVSDLLRQYIEIKRERGQALDDLQAAREAIRSAHEQVVLAQRSLFLMGDVRCVNTDRTEGILRAALPQAAAEDGGR